MQDNDDARYIQGLDDRRRARQADGDGPIQDVVQGDESTYFPSTDPVVGTDREGQTRVVGGFDETSMDSMDVARSASDGEPGDAALGDAIRRELREDAATTDLQIGVAVRRGVAYLSGRVDGMEDAEMAEEVARRIPGVRDIVDETTVNGV